MENEKKSGEGWKKILEYGLVAVAVVTVVPAIIWGVSRMFGKGEAGKDPALKQALKEHADSSNRSEGEA